MNVQIFLHLMIYLYAFFQLPKREGYEEKYRKIRNSKYGIIEISAI